MAGCAGTLGGVAIDWKAIAPDQKILVEGHYRRGMFSGQNIGEATLTVDKATGLPVFVLKGQSSPESQLLQQVSALVSTGVQSAAATAAK